MDQNVHLNRRVSGTEIKLFTAEPGCFQKCALLFESRSQLFMLEHWLKVYPTTATIAKLWKQLWTLGCLELLWSPILELSACRIDKSFFKVPFKNDYYLSESFLLQVLIALSNCCQVKLISLYNDSVISQWLGILFYFKNGSFLVPFPQLYCGKINWTLTLLIVRVILVIK